jgi:hypothetical protein
MHCRRAALTKIVPVSRGSTSGSAVVHSDHSARWSCQHGLRPPLILSLHYMHCTADTSSIPLSSMLLVPASHHTILQTTHYTHSIAKHPLPRFPHRLLLLWLAQDFSQLLLRQRAWRHELRPERTLTCRKQVTKVVLRRLSQVLIRCVWRQISESSHTAETAASVPK